MPKTKIKLILEKGKSGIWGRVDHEDNLIADSAPTQEIVEKKIKILLNQFHGLKEEDIEFEIEWEK